MQTHYDEDLIEAAVFIGASGRRPGVPPLQVRRFHADRERAYAVVDPDARNQAFFQTHFEWFREWGLQRQLLQAVDAHPLLPRHLDLLAFRKARTRQEEGAELYVNHGARTAVVALRPDRFADTPGLDSFLHHELLHLDDMVDPRFDYSPHLDLQGQPPSQLRIARERYRLLWDVTIDGRLAGRGIATTQTAEGHRRSFDRAFSFWPGGKRDDVFAELWGQPQPTHARLASLATDPRDQQTTRVPLPGSPCPLCGFPTFHWAPVADLTPALIQSIRADFPPWEAGHGACQRCVEMYAVASRFEYPPTVVF